MSLCGAFYFRLQETLEQSLGPKVKSVISSTVTLCPSDKPHPPPLKKPSSSQAPSKYINCVHKRNVIMASVLSLQLLTTRLMFKSVKWGGGEVGCEVGRWGGGEHCEEGRWGGWEHCHSNPVLVHFIFQIIISSHHCTCVPCLTSSHTINISCSMSVKLSYIDGPYQ